MFTRFRYYACTEGDLKQADADLLLASSPIIAEA